MDIEEADVRAAADGFLGEIDQVPPMYSALKRDGRPLYEYARAGLTLERAPRRVTIRSIDLIDFAPAAGACAGEPGSVRAVLRVACSKGTYIRTLAEDIGRVLGCGAHLSALRRERVGALSLAGAVSLERLEAMTPAERLACLAPVDSLLAALPVVRLDDEHARRFLHGQRLRLTLAESRRADPRVRVYLRDALLGIATLDGSLLVPQRLVGNAQESAAADAQ